MRHGIRSAFGILALGLALSTNGLAANTLLGQVELRAASKVERNAGVWLDGQYLGHLRDLRRGGRLTVVPGERHLLVRLAGYEEISQTIVVEPGQRQRYRVSMVPQAGVTYPDAEQTAELRIAVKPKQAAVFVNDVYAGNVSRFNSRRGMRLRAGVHRIKITLPGYQAFETEVTLLANQRYEIRTDLPRGSITQQSEQLMVRGQRE